MQKFWRRQFDENVTKPQTIFDVVFGIVTPIVCFVLDPIVLKSNLSVFNTDRGIVLHSGAFYLFGTITICLLTLWLRYQHKFDYFGGGAAFGIFLVGGIASAIIGLLLFPFALLAIITAVLVTISEIARHLSGIRAESCIDHHLWWVPFYAVFAMTPLFTGFVYIRNGSRASRYAIEKGDTYWVTAAAWAGINLAIAIPIAAQVKLATATHNAVNLIVASETGRDEAAEWRLRFLSLTPNIGLFELQSIVKEYKDEKNQLRRENLAQTYHNITGLNIEKHNYVFH